MRRRFYTISPKGVIVPEFDYGPNDVLVYVLWGQSNMFGSSNSYSSYSDALKGPQNARVFKNPSHNSSGVWQQLQAGINHQNVTAPNSSVGPILSLGLELSTYIPNRIHIVHHSKGGTRLKPLSTGVDWNPASANELWEDLMRDVTTAKTKLIAEGKNPIFKGILQFQGESDAVSDTESPGIDAYTSGSAAYAGYLSDLNLFYNSTFTRWSGTYGIDTSKVNICIVKMANYYTDPIREYHPEIRQAIIDFCAADPSKRGVVDIDDLGPNVDGSHLSATAQIQVGKRAANYFKNFI